MAQEWRDSACVLRQGSWQLFLRWYLECVTLIKELRIPARCMPVGVGVGVCMRVCVGVFCLCVSVSGLPDITLLAA